MDECDSGQTNTTHLWGFLLQRKSIQKRFPRQEKTSRKCETSAGYRRRAAIWFKYPRPVFHRLDVRHARHTWKDGFAILWANPLFSKKQAMLTDKTNNKNDKAFLIPQLLAMNHKKPPVIAVNHRGSTEENHQSATDKTM